jgi:hypothetical protein
MHAMMMVLLEPLIITLKVHNIIHLLLPHCKPLKAQWVQLAQLVPLAQLEPQATQGRLDR